MAELRLGKLPDHTPVKLTVSLTPQLHADLGRYAAAYREAQGQEEAVEDLVPAMLNAFLDSDREFSVCGRCEQAPARNDYSRPGAARPR